MENGSVEQTIQRAKDLAKVLELYDSDTSQTICALLRIIRAYDENQKMFIAYLVKQNSVRKELNSMAQAMHKVYRMLSPRKKRYFLSLLEGDRP